MEEIRRATLTRGVVFEQVNGTGTRLFVQRRPRRAAEMAGAGGDAPSGGMTGEHNHCPWFPHPSATAVSDWPASS